MIKTLLTTDYLASLAHYNKIIVGYSGGLDSTVLLHSLAQEPLLLKKLVAVHINHGISPHALVWQNHCFNFCQSLSIPLIIEQVDFLCHSQANLEEEARKARYQVFSSLLTSVDCLLLGHHFDDQAETLLLQLFRGAGVDGLAAMVGQKSFAKGQLLRPLLAYSRQQLESYALSQKLGWVDDESNQDISYSRNFIRHQVLPLLRQRWPGVESNLVRTSQLCQQAQKNLAVLAQIDYPMLKECSNTLSLSGFITLDEDRIANILHYWLKANQVKIPAAVFIERIIKEVIKAKKDANPLIQWKSISIRRYQQTLYLAKQEAKALHQSYAWPLFPQPLDLEGIGQLSVAKQNKGLIIPPHARLEIRFRQGGELFHWHGQRKQLKKLFQEWRVPTWLRDRLPLLYINGKLAQVVGYAIADTFYGEESQNNYQISLSS